MDHGFLLGLLWVVQLAYLFGMLVVAWFYTLRVDVVEVSRDVATPDSVPPIILVYPVLRELEATMRTTLLGLTQAEYPADRLRIVAIPNADDWETVASLNRLRNEYPFLEVLPVPPTTDGSWGRVWAAWDLNPKAYWWHAGKRAGITKLPPKKTRQLVWAMYQLAPGNEDALLSYIDADSVVPADFFKAAALGMQDFDVLQCTNVTGNLLHTWPASFFAMDHIAWDPSLYPHMTAGGKHPYWVLGKGLFFRLRDLLGVGGFHPWLTIEDPEIGMRLWVNGRRLGVVKSPLIEEVPLTFGEGITQRKRWVAGFFQSLASPLTQMGMPLRKRWRARMNFVPCLSLLINPFGYAVGIWTLTTAITSPTPVVDGPLQWLSITNLVLATIIITHGQIRAWRVSRLVLPDRRDRLRFLVRVNPVFMFAYWLWWSVPIMIGFWMFVRDTGLVWDRTVKRDANHQLTRRRTAPSNRGANAPTGGPDVSIPIESGPAK